MFTAQRQSVSAEPHVRRARAAVSALFFTNGAMFASLVPRYPEIKRDFDLGNTGYGFTVAAFPVGALTVGLAAGFLVRRFGSAKVAVASTMLTAGAILAAGASPSMALLALALLAAGGSDAVADVGQNAHGLLVQRRYGRSVINSFHALWSAGVVFGGVLAAGAIALDVSRTVQLAVSGALSVGIALAAYRYCLAEREQPQKAPADGPQVPYSQGTGLRPRALPVFAGISAIAIAACLVEDAGNSWAAVYLTDSLSATATIAAGGYVALASAQLAGRALGDRLIDRFGQQKVTRLGGILIMVGMGAALTFPTVPGTVAGFAAMGFGVATLGPTAMQAADELPGLRPGTGLTIISWLMRVGFLVSPPLVGMIADASSLRVGLLAFPTAGLVIFLTSPTLAAKNTRKTAES
ncbi:MAG TPA: MFS transporter [Streptomyces sp.]